jgi:carboxylesterase type B
VYVNSGGLVEGRGEDAHIDPEKLFHLSKDIGKPVIFAAINFRLGVFGFARLPLLKKERSLNMGIRDQRAAFQWAKDHIGSFGGDAKRITADGVSAGGTTTSLQLMAYGGAQGVPFTQAWVISGPPGMALNMSSDMTEGHTRAVAARLDCERKTDEKLLECMREIPMENLLSTAVEYAQANFPPLGLFTFIPSVDNDFFPGRPSVLSKGIGFVSGECSASHASVCE